MQHGKESPAPLDVWLQDYPNVNTVLEFLKGDTPIEPMTEELYAQMTPEEVLVWGEKNLKLLVDAANYSTIAAFPAGFNVHDFDGHIKPIGQDAIKFADEWGVGRESQKLVVLADLFHDLGMIYSRKDHPLISPRIFAKLTGDFAWSKIGKEVVNIIINHDDGVFHGKVDDWLVHNPRWSEHEIYQRMQDEIGPEGIYLIMLDKIQFGIERVTPNNHEYLVDPMTDEHTMVTSFLRKRGEWYLTNTSGVAELKLAFNPDLNGLEKQFDHIMHETKAEVKAPAAMHKVHQEHGYPHIFWWMERFVKVYESRMNTLARAAFALDPNLTEFQVNIADNIEGGARMGFEIVISRGGLMQVLDPGEIKLGQLGVSKQLHEVVSTIAQITSDTSQVDYAREVAPGLSFWIKAQDSNAWNGMRKLFSPKERRKGKIHER